MVRGADGVWAARTGRAIDHRRCEVAQDAGSDELEDQVPRELPAIRAQRVARARFRILRSEGGKSLHAAGGAGRAIVPQGNDGGRAKALWTAKAPDDPLHYSGRDTRRLFGARANGHRGRPSVVLS